MPESPPIVAPHRKAFAGSLPKGGVGIEVGCHVGKFARTLMDKAKPKLLHMVDLWTRHADTTENYKLNPSARTRALATQRMIKEIKTHRCIVHQGFSSDVIPIFPDHYFDWAYIDAAHEYEYVLDDLLKMAPKIKPPGILWGHDYTPFNKNSGNKYGIIEAVAEFLRQQAHWEMLGLTGEPEFPSFVLRRRR